MGYLTYTFDSANTSGKPMRFIEISVPMEYGYAYARLPDPSQLDDEQKRNLSDWVDLIKKSLLHNLNARKAMHLKLLLALVAVRSKNLAENPEA